jgi:hypothetical protein
MNGELIFKLDEVGVSELKDRKERKAIVLRTIETQTIHHRESRSGRNISIIACITPGGESPALCIVTSQDSDAIRKSLMLQAVLLGVDFVLRQQSKPYISCKLFLKCINTIFVSYLNELPEPEEFEACKAVLFVG